MLILENVLILSVLIMSWDSTLKDRDIVAVEPLPKEYIKELWKNVEIPTLSEKIVASFYLIMFLGWFKILMFCS